EDLIKFASQHLADELALVKQAVAGRDEHELGRPKRLGHRYGDVVRIDAIGLAIAVKAQGRDDRQEALTNQALKQLDVDAFDLAGEQMVDAVQNAHRM